MSYVYRDLPNELLIAILNGDVLTFYKSSIWEECRDEILDRDNFECQDCKAEGGYAGADCVHHIEHLRANPHKALDPANLRSLCNSCHNKNHPEKSFKAKPKAFINDERWE